ncbi:MAG: MFS transporter, partial [Eubacterium sp.]
MSAKEKLAKKTSPFRYGFAMFGTSIPINMFKSFAAIFYVDMLGLDMKKYSLVLFIYTFIDAIDNPVYGFLSDRTRTKWGRRRPWLLIGTPLLILCFILFFNVPSFIESEKGMLFVYMLLMYILTGTLDSLMNANYGALFPELFTKDD